MPASAVRAASVVEDGAKGEVSASADGTTFAVEDDVKKASPVPAEEAAFGSTYEKSKNGEEKVVGVVGVLAPKLAG